MTSIAPAEYEYLWSNHDVNYIFTSCYLSPVFRSRRHLVLTYGLEEKKELKYFLSKENHKSVSRIHTWIYTRTTLKSGKS